MTTKTCGCSTESCGCCEGVQKLTPASTANRPGLPALSYRVGTHGAFFESMKARLSSLTLEAPGADGQTLETFQPLTGLTSRDPGDPAIALLDSWAVVGDVLTFYQERIANEGYLRTATERRSVLELARLVGYTLRPGVAATVYFAYTLEDKQLDPVEIPIGARAQSIPGPDELPQSFETSENWITRSEWNNLQVRQHKPQKIEYESAVFVDTIFVEGANANLKTGDLLLLVFGTNNDSFVVRKVREAEGQFAQQRTAIHLQPLSPFFITALRLLHEFMNAAAALPGDVPKRGAARAQQILADIFVGVAPDPGEWGTLIRRASEPAAVLEPAIKDLENALKVATNDPGAAPIRITTSPAEFVAGLLKPRIAQPASSFQLSRNLLATFRPGSDTTPQLLLSFAPVLRDTYYKAWENADVSPTPTGGALTAIFAFRLSAPLFRPPTEKKTTIASNEVTQIDWPVETDEGNDALFLDQAHESVLAGGFALIDKTFGQRTRLVRRVSAVETASRTAYGINAKTTRLQFDQTWRNGADISTVQTTLVHAQSDELKLIDEPIADMVGGQEIELAGLFKELTSGRWVILSGERADIAGVSGVRASELHMISGLRHDYDPNLPDDKTHTTPDPGDEDRL
jgi:hypothetical protein